MGVKWFKTNLKKQSKDLFLRFDCKYHQEIDFSDWNIFGSKSFALISLNEILMPYYVNFTYGDDVYKGIPTGREYLDEFGDIIYCLDVTKDEHPERLKYKIDDDCILLSSLRGARTPALNFGYDLTQFVFSNGFYIFKIRNDNWNKLFILNLLRTKRVKNLIDNCIYRGIGISSYREDDLLKVKIPQIPLPTQNEIVEKIKPIEQEISALKASKTPQIDIINEVFGDEFGFDWKKFNELRRQNLFKSSIFDFSGNEDCRMGCRFQHPAGQYMMSFLRSKFNKRVKHYVSAPICLGKGVSPSEYDENGEYKYIAMSSFPKFVINLEDSKSLNDDFAKQNLDKSLEVGDIVLARSGEGTIGKVALVEEENIKAIFADFTQRIRLINYNTTFAYYYFRSEFFQYLVYTEKKGLGNNTNIFPSQIQEFPIPDFDLQKQSEIVQKIQTRFEAQKDIDKQIEAKRDKISRLIESVI